MGQHINFSKTHNEIQKRAIPLKKTNKQKTSQKIKKNTPKKKIGESTQGTSVKHFMGFGIRSRYQVTVTSLTLPSMTNFLKPRSHTLV